MNARERAKALIEYRHQDLLIYEIEKVIIAAEEARAKEEREACEVIVKKEIERWDREFVGELRESIIIEIRARSEGEKKGG